MDEQRAENRHQNKKEDDTDSNRRFAIESKNPPQGAQTITRRR
jgi:hypothetical protein